MDQSQQPIEPQFLSSALTQGIKLRIGQMNKTEHEGVVRDIGRYEINIEEHGKISTLLKKDICYLAAPSPLIVLQPRQEDSAASSPEAAQVKPNVQQEFLDKAIRENHHLTIFLLTGQRVKAVIESYDNFTLLVRDGSRQFLYYKHAVTTINR
ncbi:MAG: RNA chaperone Hfq [Nitrospiraceae bacterium]|nr:RNA chaperone Hfq [Nitrospiraceae bacterium]